MCTVCKYSSSAVSRLYLHTLTHRMSSLSQQAVYGIIRVIITFVRYETVFYTPYDGHGIGVAYIPVKPLTRLPADFTLKSYRIWYFS